MINDARRFFISWRFAGGLINRYKFRARGPAAGDKLLLAFYLHISGGLGRGVEIQSAWIAVPLNEVSGCFQVFYRTAIAAVGYV